ncbi:MAG: DUF2203 domain-containing protein [Myxococcaceae bacterium]|nr:DUF2203 domain-containing protein [Myxococcaceae bacterium]
MRHFGLEEANKLIPLLTQTFDDVRPKLVRLKQVVDDLEAHKEPQLELKRERVTLTEDIRDRLMLLEDMGIEIKAADGLVDFRALLGEKTVYLCWRYPEPEITHWHELEQGYPGRRLIRPSDAFMKTYAS